jgi:pectinesterase
MKKIFFLLAAMITGCFVLGQPVTITVAKDGSGNYSTVQQALDAVPLNNKNRVIIFIKKGIYKEKLHLDSTKNAVTMQGEDKRNTILTYDDHTGKTAPDGSVINTQNSQTFYIRADDFLAMDLTFENNAGMTAGQAVAVRVEGDRAIFLNCRIIGFQDTLFASAENSRQYYKACYIEGSTDFIFGAATVLFEDCHIHSKKNSHVTAASTPKDHEYGFVFKKCVLTADTSVHKVSLGRPWRPYASVSYLECTIGDHIIPQGWDNWRNPENEKTARYSEYKNQGTGADTSARVNWSRQLTGIEAKKMTSGVILRGWRPDIKSR